MYYISQHSALRDIFLKPVAMSLLYFLSLSSSTECLAVSASGSFSAGRLGETMFGSLHYEQAGTRGFQGDSFFGQADPLQVPEQILAFKNANQSISGVFTYDTSLTPLPFNASNTRAGYQGGTLSASVNVPLDSLLIPTTEIREISTDRLNLNVSNEAGGDRFRLDVSSTSFGIFSNFNGLEIPTLMPLTQGFDLLQDTRFADRAIGIPSLSSIPVRLAESPSLILSELEVNMVDFDASVFGGTGLPNDLLLRDFESRFSDLLLRFRQEYEVAVREEDYPDRGSFELAEAFIESTELSIQSGWFTFTNVTDFEAIARPLTSNEADPILPTCDCLQIPFEFNEVDGTGGWFDPVAANGFLYETDGSSKFTRVGLPANVPDSDGEYIVVDPQLGEVVVSPGGFFNFTTPVESFTILGIDPSVDGEDPQAFPTFLEFDQTTVSFTMAPITVPEPTSATLSILSLLMIGYRRQLIKHPG